MATRTTLVEEGATEEAQGFQQEAASAVAQTGRLPKLRNLADDDKTKDWITQNLVPVIIHTVNDRQRLEDEWHAVRRMDEQVHDDGQRYRGRSQAYLPVYAAGKDTQVAIASQALFPSDEYMDVVDRKDKNADNAKAVKRYIQWELENNAHIRTELKKLLGSLFDYGTMIAKVKYSKKLRMTGKNRLLPNVLGAPTIQSSFMNETQEGLQVSARNLFYWYIYPVMSESIDDSTLVFEEIDTSVMFIKEMERRKIWMNVADAMAQRSTEFHEYNRQAFNESVSDYTDNAAFSDSPIGGMRVLRECWTYMEVPADQYLDREDVGAPVPVRILLAGTVPVEVKRNPYFHQRKPYLDTRMKVKPGRYYGSGIGKKARPMQYLTNDFANQMNDCGSMTMNPIIKYNPSYMTGPLRPIAPGVMWPMTNLKEGVAFDRPPVELIQYGQTLVSMYAGMTQDYMGAPPAIQGIGAGKAAKTATGAQILNKNARGPIQDTVEDVESQFFVPLCQMTWWNAQQYREQDVIADVMGEPFKVTPAQLAGDYDFRWMASSQASNAQMRAQQAISLLQALAPPPVQQNLAQNGYMLNLEPVIKRTWVDGFGFRGFDDVIKKMPPAPMGALPPGAPQPAPGAPGATPPTPAPDRIRSAVEQAQGGTSDITPGEGEDFNAVRANADDLASAGI